jgi:pimeloyl-ACP methyl ester carboxylesterase
MDTGRRPVKARSAPKENRYASIPRMYGQHRRGGTILAAVTLIVLADGRELDIQVTGPQDGIPLVMHHGTPGSLVRFRAIDEAVHRRGLRMVTYSRAGYGASTRRPGRTVADIAADVTAVLDHIGAQRCLTLGWSGGGPHALASAALLPGRVVAATTIASVGPYGAENLDFLEGMGEGNIEEFGAALAGEAKLAAALDEAAAELRGAGPADVMEAMSTLLPPEDLAVLAGEAGEELAAQVNEGVRLGAAGWIDDDLAFVNAWGFSVADIGVPVFLWQGDRDLMVPFAHGRWLAERIPGAVAHLMPGEGHLSVFTNRVDEVLDELAATLD